MSYIKNRFTKLVKSNLLASPWGYYKKLVYLPKNLGMMRNLISHIKESNNQWEIQTNEEHQNGVAGLASQFASEFGMTQWGRVLGLLHDKGKEQKTFQQHIKKESGYKPDITVEGDYNHAYVGALIAKELFKSPPYYQFIDNILMGHHRGLYDHGDKEEILKKKIPDDVSVETLSEELKKEKLNIPPLGSLKDVHHLIRMLYSCLVDADYLDTERFMMPKQSLLRGGKSTLEELLLKLEVYLSNLKRNAADTEVNKIRNEIQQYCINASEGDVDFYSLTVPTGGGKTLSSVLWALRHAKKNGLRRVIIAIPYTSIITQTAATLRNIFGDENVLEHHSNVNLMDENESSQRLKLATENWDYPIVVTTNVQLFESLFSNKPSDCRKLHNIVNSVLILDEVQTLPMGFLQPIVDTLDTLKRVFNVSILFTTASQPVLNGRIEGTNPLVGFDALPQIKEIVPPKADLHERLRRVILDIDNIPQSYDDIAKKMAQHSRVLCIVNTRKDAKEIYSRLPKEGICLHLSRMMCPAHVRETIESIKDALKSDSNKVIRVVATQLIEAGVDIDFPVVYRQEAGLDSILQAAGRCNREGRLELCTTHVFTSQNGLPRGFIMQTNNARKNMVGDYDWFSSKAMTEYFRQLHAQIDNFDKPKIEELLYTPKEMQFEEAANNFQLIDDSTTSIVVNWEKKNVQSLIEHLQSEGFSYSLMKEITQYSVNVRNKDLKILLEAGVIEEIKEGVLFVRDTDFYDEKIGLTTGNHWLEESLIV